MRLIAYVRVSLEGENPENQEFAIYKWASEHGHQVVGVVRDVGVGGAVPPRDRPGFRQVLERLAEVDGIVVYALDRVARSLTELVDVFREVESRGRVIISVREDWLQDLDPKVRSLIVAVLGWAGEMEREFIRERTREALARARAQGKRIGRPPRVNEATLREAVRYIERGLTLKETAKLLGVGYTTLARALTQSPTWRTLYYEARAKGRLHAKAL